MVTLDDEAGFQTGPTARTTWALCGRTPVLRCRGRGWGRVNAAAALVVSPGPRRNMRSFFRLYDGTIDGAVFASFMRELLCEIRGGVVIIWDGWSVHKAPEVKALLAERERVSVQVLPAYAPELNPVEHLWSHSKEVGLRGYVPEDKLDLELEAGVVLDEIGESQRLLRGFVKGTPLHIPGV